MEGNHPDFITVEDPEHKNVAVKIVRQFREDVFIRPNESDYKIYLFPQELGLEGQNALLKILEEPPPYGVFLLLTDNPEKLLPTVRSRCTELKLLPLPETILLRQLEREFPNVEPEAIRAACNRGGGYLGQAKELLENGDAIQPHIQGMADALCGKQPMALMQLLVPMEKWKRDALLPALNDWLELAQGALACRAGLPAVSPLARQLSLSRTPAELMQIVACLKKAIENTQSNVSPAAVCGYLEWALR